MIWPSFQALSAAPATASASPAALRAPSAPFSTFPSPPNRSLLDLIKQHSRGWRRDRLKPFPELRFTYEEGEQACRISFLPSA